MIKTFEQLNKEYVPSNKSTNFSNNTCRRRLLDKYIGAGKWEYVYEGSKAVAVKVAVEEVEEVVEEVVEEQEAEVQVEELKVASLKTVAECEAAIKSCNDKVEAYQQEIVKLQELIKDIETRKLVCGSARGAFKGIKFSRYSMFRYVEEVYEEVLRRYEECKSVPGIHAEFEKMQEKYMKQTVRFVANSAYPYKETFEETLARLRFEGKEISSDKELELMKDAYKDVISGCDIEVALHFKRDYFVDELNEWQINNLKALKGAVEKVLGQCGNCRNSEYYKQLERILDTMNKSEADRKAFNERGEKKFRSFCANFRVYYTSRQRARQNSREQRRQEYYRQQQYWNDFWGTSSAEESVYFSGCTTKSELKKKHKEWAMKLHPDRGGNEEQFKEMQNEYDRLFKQFA